MTPGPVGDMSHQVTSQTKRHDTWGWQQVLRGLRRVPWRWAAWRAEPPSAASRGSAQRSPWSPWSSRCRCVYTPRSSRRARALRRRLRLWLWVGGGMAALLARAACHEMPRKSSRVLSERLCRCVTLFSLLLLPHGLPLFRLSRACRDAVGVES
jgi:hypothetical protein